MTEDFFLLCKKAGIIDQMVRRGLLYCKEDGECQITGKGLELIGRPFPAITGFVPFIDAFRELFPKGIRSGGYLVKGSKGGCVRKMKKFLDTHPEYSQEVILKATKAYVDRKSKEGWKFMSLAHNFIEKDSVSQLEVECENIMSPSNTITDFTKDI